MSKHRNIRKKRALGDVADELEDHGQESLRSRLEATRDLQKFRQRPQGLTTDRLAGAGSQKQGDSLDGTEQEAVHELTEEETSVDKKHVNQPSEGAQPKKAELLPADSLYAIPVELQAQKVTQEDVSAWMKGIEEVPLSVSQVLKNIKQAEEATKQALAKGSGETHEEEAQPTTSSPEGPKRLTYPLRFGKQTEEAQAWRDRALLRGPQTRDKKKRKQGS